MEGLKPEEKSPLLLYMAEGEEHLSQNNKRINFDKGRLYGISSGATAVFTDFPNYISPCGITALFSSLIFFLLVLLMVSTIGPSNSIRVPRCTHSNPEHLGNKTIHLVHDLYQWNREELDFLERIKNHYVGYGVHLVLLRTASLKSNEIMKLQEILQNNSLTLNETNINISTTTKKNNKRNLKRKKRARVDAPRGIGYGVKSLLDILLHSRAENNEVKLLTDQILNLTEPFPTTTPSKPKTLDDVISDFPGLSVQNVTLKEAFSDSPLQNVWRNLNWNLTIFAVRVLHLWQYGGLSFKVDGVGGRERGEWSDAENFSVAPEITLAAMKPSPPQILHPVNDKLLNFIRSGRTTFENLPNEVVTADDEGLHIFTKTPCHVFFGEIIVNLKSAKGDETPKNIIQKSLRVFCKHSAVGNNYCRHLVRAAV